MGLIVEVGGEITAFSKTMETLKADLISFEAQLEKATDPKAIQKLNSRIKETKLDIQDLKEAGGTLTFKGFDAGIAEARVHVRELKAEISNLSTGELSSGYGQKLSSELRVARSELKQLETQANISSKVTGNAFIDTIQPIKGVSSQIRSLGRIIPGIGIAGLFGLIATGAEALITHLTSLTGVEKKLQDQSEKLKSELKDTFLIAGEGAASEEGTVSKVQALASAISDANTPYREKKRAIQELREVNKNYFGDLKIEDALTGKLTSTITEYTNALINAGIQKEFISEIANIAKSVAKADDDIKRSKDKLTRANYEITAAENEVTKARAKAIVQGQNQQGTNSAVLDAVNKLQEAKNKQKKVEEDLYLANDKSTQLMEQELVVRNDLNRAVTEGLKYKDLDTQHTKKEEDALKKRLEALQKIQALTKDATTRVGLQEQIFELQVKISIRDAKKNGLSKDEVDKAILGYKAELQKEFLAQATELEAIPKVKFSDVARVTIPTPVVDKISKATGKEKITVTLHDARILMLGAKTTAIIEGTEAINKQLSKQINDTLSNLKIDAAVNLGQLFGNLLSGQDFGSALKKSAGQMLSVIGDTLQQLGKYVITAAIQIQALKKILENFAIKNPGLAIAAGIGLIALGATLKNVQFPGPKFASGGIVTGPTVGMVGEAGPEAIIPLSRLQNLIGGTSSTAPNINIGMGIKGRELVAFLQRETALFNRIH